MRLSKQQADGAKLRVGTKRLMTSDQLNWVLDRKFQSDLDETETCQDALEMLINFLQIDRHLVKPNCEDFWFGKARTTVFTSRNPVRSGWNVEMKTYKGRIPVFVLYVHNDGYAVWVNQNVIDFT